MTALFLISLGAALGASLRYGLGLWLNPIFASVSFGTLIANYAGCLIIGSIMALIEQFPTFSNEWRLFLITGLLGSLTTFSSFASEVITAFLIEKWLWGLSLIVMHLLGSLVCTALGFFLIRCLLKA